MKNYVFAAMLVAAVLLVAGLANATVVLTNPTLGSQNQERGVNAITSFSATDSSLSTVTTATVIFTLTSNSGYAVVFDDTGLTTKTVTNWDGTQRTFNVRALVPLNHDAVDANLNAVAFQVATISQNRDSVTAPVKMQAANHLELDKIKISVDGVTKTVEDGDDIKDIKVGDELDIEITIENTYSGNDDEDLDIEDVDVRAQTTDNDFDIDEDDETDVSADESETLNFDKIIVDDDVSDGTYTLEVTADGRDENGARHGEIAEIDLKVERESHEIQIRSTTLSRSTVSCENPTTDVVIRLANIGKSDEDDVVAQVQNTVLGISQRTAAVSIDEDGSITRTISLTPKLDKVGTHTLDVTAYFNNNIETDRSQLTLTVAACPTTTTTTTTTPSTVVVTPTPTVTTTTTTTPPATTNADNTASVPKARVSSTSKTDYTIPLLIGGVIVAVVLAGLLIAVLVRGKSA